MSDALSHTPRKRGHEVADVSGRRIALIAAALVAVLVVVALASLATRGILRPDRTSNQSMFPTAIVDLATLRREKSAMLNAYGWIDKNQSIVRIPIDRAMQLMVERSASTRHDPNQPTEPPR